MRLTGVRRKRDVRHRSRAPRNGGKQERQVRMALSDIVRKIEDSPRSTKVAVVSLGIAVIAVGVAIFAVMDQSDSESEPASPVVRVSAAPTATSVPSPAPRPTPVPTNTPAPTATPQPTATPLPAETPLPTATATPDVSDYFVILHQGRRLGDGIGAIAFYAEYPFRKKKAEGSITSFHNEDFYLDYLVKERIITPKQKDDYFNGEPIQKISLVAIGTATLKLKENDPYNFGRLRIGDPEYILYYADESAVGSSSGGGISLEGDDGYVRISDGRVSVSAVDGDGNATTVELEGVGAQELLDYWLSENKITIEQRNQYGETGQLEFSLKDGVDLFDFGYSSDVEFYTGMDREAQDVIINEILPLFAGD